MSDEKKKSRVKAIVYMAIIIGLSVLAIRHVQQQKRDIEIKVSQEYGGLSKQSGRYKSIDEVYTDAIAWVDRYENGRVNEAELYDAMKTLYDEAYYYTGSRAQKIQRAIDSVRRSSMLSNKTKIYNAIDDLRRIE